MTANAKRAVAATLDRLNAEKRLVLAEDELNARRAIEREALAALTEDERSEYQTAVSNAYNDQQHPQTARA